MGNYLYKEDDLAYDCKPSNNGGLKLIEFDKTLPPHLRMGKMRRIVDNSPQFIVTSAFSGLSSMFKACIIMLAINSTRRCDCTDFTGETIGEYLFNFNKSVGPSERTNDPSKVIPLKNTLPCLKSILDCGLSFVFGMHIFESFPSTNKWKGGGWSYPIPEKGERCLGALCFVCVGYDDTNNWYIIHAPFGNRWGDNGYFYVPYDVMEGTALMEGSTVVSPQQCIYEKDYCFDFYLLK